MPEWWLHLGAVVAAHAVERRGVGLGGGGVGVETVGAHDLKIVILERRHF